MTFSHYSAEENNTQSKLAIMMTLPSADLSEGLTFPILGVVVFFDNRPFCSANSGDPDQVQHCAASHLGLCCLPISSHKRTLD